MFITMQCGSGRSVAAIKAGFQARVGRRNAGTWSIPFLFFFQRLTVFIFYYFLLFIFAPNSALLSGLPVNTEYISFVSLLITSILLGSLEIEMKVSLFYLSCATAQRSTIVIAIFFFFFGYGIRYRIGGAFFWSVIVFFMFFFWI